MLLVLKELSIHLACFRSCAVRDDLLAKELDHTFIVCTSLTISTLVKTVLVKGEKIPLIILKLTCGIFFNLGCDAQQASFSVQSLSKILTSEGLTSSPADLTVLDRNPLKLMSQSRVSGKVAHAVYLLQSH